MNIVGIDKENFEAVKGFFPADTLENLENPEFTVYAAVDHEGDSAPEVSGVLSFFVEQAEDEDAVKIDWLFVVPEKRRMGVGSYLLSELIDTAKEAGISFIYANLPDDEDEALEGVFRDRGYEIDTDYMPFFEGTIGELKTGYNKNRIAKVSLAVWTEVSDDDAEEIRNLCNTIDSSKNQDETVKIDLSDENKANLFEKLFGERAVTVVRRAYLNLEDEFEDDKISLDESLMLLDADTPYKLPRFNALVGKVSEVRDDYEVGADSHDGPYILLPVEGVDFKVKLCISLDNEDTESYALTALAEFEIDIAELETLKKKLELWENEVLYTVAGIDTAYEKIIFTAGIPCVNSLPDTEDILEFAGSFAKEVKAFYEITDSEEEE